MQKLIVTGRLGKDAQQKTPSNGGNPFVLFTIASNSKFKGEEKTTWYDIIMHITSRNKGIIPYLTKGKGVVVTGELDLSTYEDKGNNTRIRASVNADSIDFWGDSGQKQDNNGTTETDAAPVVEKPKKASKQEPKAAVDIPMTATPDPLDASDDDLPF